MCEIVQLLFNTVIIVNSFVWGQHRVFVIHHHVWVRYIDTTIIMVWCMSSLLFSIDLRWFCYFIMLYFKLTNGALVKWWMVKWCNGEIKNSTGYFFSHKYWICSFVLFSNTPFLQQKKQSMIFNFWSLTTSTATKFIWDYLVGLTSFFGVQEFIRICE